MKRNVWAFYGVRLLCGVVVPLLAVLVWEILSQQGPEYAYAFVPVHQIVGSFHELLRTGDLYLNISASVNTALRGFLIGSVLGILMGLVMAYFRAVDELLNPVFQALRQVPNLALVPLIGLWFGNSEFSKMLVVCLGVFEVMTLNTYEGLHRVDQRYLDVARALTLSRFRTFRRILIPAALPSMSTGVQHAVAFAWLSTVGAELLFTVGPGISGVMERAQMGARMDIVIICLVFIALLGFAMQLLCKWISNWLLRWRHAAY